MSTEATRPQETFTGEVPPIAFSEDGTKVRILDIELDVLPLPDDPMAARFIPKWELMKDYTCFDTPTVLLLRDMAIALTTQESIRLEGPPGVSKSFAAELISGLTNRSFVRHNYSRDSEVGDTVGKFIPADATLAVRLDELLADPEVQAKADIKNIVQNAIDQSRPLSRFESKKIAAALGIDGLEDDKAWRWKNGTLTGSMIYGAEFLGDERNLAPGNVTERENPATEGKRSSLRIVEHEGEVIRPLTPDEQDIIDGGGIIPGVFGLHSRFWFVSAQNPYGIGGGRMEESSAARNRQRDRIVEALDVKDYEAYIRFLITGKQPDISLHNKRFKGETIQSPPFIELQSIPNVEIFIQWLAKFHTDLDKLAQEGSIGSERDMNGGSYVYTRRNIDRLLSTVRGLQNGALLDMDKLFKTGERVTNSSSRDIVWEAIRVEYLDSMYRKDNEAVTKVVEASGILDYLGDSINNPKPPAWVAKARNSGLQVDQGSGTWRLSKMEMQNMGLDFDELETLFGEDFVYNDLNGDEVEVIRILEDDTYGKLSKRQLEEYVGNSGMELDKLEEIPEEEQIKQVLGRLEEGMDNE